jgi:DNA-binding response OmpR family regulator
MLILVASSRLASLRTFLNALSLDSSVSVLSANKGAAALELVREQKPSALVVDVVDDMSALELAAASLRVNAFVNTAVVSAQDEESFHEQSEGLGVLMRLSDPPLPSEAATLIEKLKALG